jgi:hypothetical protein
LLKALWARWKLIAQKIADFQARAMLSAFYFAVLGPFALGLKICSDPLRLHRAAAESWLPRPQTPGDAVTLARRQF